MLKGWSPTEVERAAKLLRDVASGKKITEVETSEDTIVYTGGITHTQFVSEEPYATLLLRVNPWWLGGGTHRTKDCRREAVWQVVLHDA